MTDPQAQNAHNAQNPHDPAEHLKPHRWRKGQSGNPGGRPKGSSVRATLKRVLAQKHNGRSYLDLLGELIYREAMKGKAAFVRELLDRLEGRPQDPPAQGLTVQTVVFQITEAAPPPGWSAEGSLPALPDQPA